MSEKSRSNPDPLVRFWRPLEKTGEHAELLAAAEPWRTFPIREHLAADPARVAALTWTIGEWTADLSKQAWDRSVVERLVALAEAVGLQQAIAALFAGEALNFTENRPALHMACRGGAPVPDADRARFAESEAHFAALVTAYRAGQVTGASGATLDTVVNLGIGGSDVGPRLIAEALAHWGYPQHGRVRFVANIDPNDFTRATADLDPARTLYVVTSKSFSTAETLTNSRLARLWLSEGLGMAATDPRLNRHFVAITSAPAKAEQLGYDRDRILWLPEWVGGRYSLWSSVGLPIALTYGMEPFAELRAGAAEVDQIFRTTPLLDNLPVILGLLGVWLATYLDQQQYALLPYAQGLQLLPAWLQQLEMESNGKRVRRDGSLAPYPTAMAVWGMVGTLGQHAFHQWFYQGTRPIALEFVAFADAAAQEGNSALAAARRKAAWALAANAIAQAEALLVGRSRDAAYQALLARGVAEHDAEQLAPHLEIPGNRPSTFLMARSTGARALGQLLALYEHATFVRGFLWGINPFDQFGVELGKEMARGLTTSEETPHDPSTAQLLALLKKAAR